MTWRDPAPRRQRTPTLSLALACCAGWACAAAAPAPPPAPAPAADELRIRLVFGSEADLDLYVTDPARETIYFANTPSGASGGALEADRRCDAPAPRIETVRFAPAPPGRYRVGVDYPERCRPGAGATSFRIVVEHAGGRSERVGRIGLGEFQPTVLEFRR